MAPRKWEEGYTLTQKVPKSARSLSGFGVGAAWLRQQIPIRENMTRLFSDPAKKGTLFGEDNF